MRYLIIFLLLALSNIAFADQSVNGYYRKDGTYVQPYTRSSPNNTVRDNYGYKGNTNPYTGETGTNKYKDNPTSEYYGQPKRNNGYSR